MEGSAIHSINSEETTRMTSEEAQAVIDIWAERQRQFENEATMPSTKELAEALNVPESEIVAMLRKVRAVPEPVVAQGSSGAFRFQPPKSLFIALAVMLLVGIIFSFVFPSSNRTTIVEPPALPALGTVVEAAPMAAPTSESTAISTGYLPKGIAVRFDSESILEPISMPASWNLERVRAETNNTIQSFVRSKSNLPRANSDQNLTMGVLIKSLLEGTNRFPDFVVWRNLEIQVGNDVLTTKIPISIHENNDTIEAVNSEASRRISKLTSQAVEKLRNMAPPDAAPADGR